MSTIDEIAKLWIDYKNTIPEGKPGEILLDKNGKILNISPTLEGFMNYLAELHYQGNL